MPKRSVGGPYRDRYFDQFYDFLRITTDAERMSVGKTPYTDVTIRTMATDTFFLEKHDEHEFGYWFKSENNMQEALELLLAKLQTRRNPLNDALYYHNCMIRFRNFLQNDKSWQTDLINMGSQNKKLIDRQRYQMLTRLGNKDSVCLMEDTSDGGRVVRKQVSPTAFRIYRKVREIKNPYITDVIDCTMEAGKYYIYEKYIDGNTLRTIIDETGDISKKDAIAYTIQILNGLSSVHAVGIIHKDIKPENIMIDRKNNAHIIDFGISREYKERQTRDTTYLGTFGFLSPEHIGIGKRQTDERSDIYCVGLLLNYMLTGTEDRTTKDSDLAPIVKKATTADIELRYQNAEEMINALGDC